MQRTDGSCYLKPHGRCKFLDAVVSGHTPFADLTRVLVTMWAMWLARRRAIHGDQFQSPMSTHCFISKFLDELDLVASHHSNPPRDLHATPRDLHVIFGELHARSRDMHVTWSSSRATTWLQQVYHETKMNVYGGLSRDGTRGAPAVICWVKND